MKIYMTCLSWCASLMVINRSETFFVSGGNTLKILSVVAMLGKPSSAKKWHIVIANIPNRLRTKMFLVSVWNESVMRINFAKLRPESTNMAAPQALSVRRHNQKTKLIYFDCVWNTFFGVLFEWNRQYHEISCKICFLLTRAGERWATGPSDRVARLSSHLLFIANI